MATGRNLTATPPAALDRRKTVAIKAEAKGASASGASAIGALLLGSMALGAMAFGALAVGAVAIGRLNIGKARIRKLRIDVLEVGRLIRLDETDHPMAAVAEIQARWASLPDAMSAEEVDAWMYDENGLPH